jgi:uncharacterized protein DUF3106
MRPFHSRLTLLAIAAGLLVAPLWAEHPRPAPARPAPAPAARPTRPNLPKSRPEHPGMILDRWNAMSPAEREKALARLPPDRQEQIRNRIQQFNKLPAAEQQRLREGYQRFNRLPPQKQQQIRDDMQHFSQLPVQRRRAMNLELGTLRDLPVKDRQARLNSDDFHGRFSPEEQGMIRDLAQILPSTPK